MKQVVVIDDVGYIRIFLKTGLKKFGYPVVAYANVEEAYEALIINENVYAILLDYNLPYLSGEEAIRFLRLKFPHIPIILVTAFGTRDVILRAIKLGVKAVEAKPINILSLVKKLDKLKEEEPETDKVEEESVEEKAEVEKEFEEKSKGKKQRRLRRPKKRGEKNEE